MNNYLRVIVGDEQLTRGATEGAVFIGAVPPAFPVQQTVHNDRSTHNTTNNNDNSRHTHNSTTNNIDNSTHNNINVNINPPAGVKATPLKHGEEDMSHITHDMWKALAHIMKGSSDAACAQLTHWIHFQPHLRQNHNVMYLPETDHALVYEERPPANEAELLRDRDPEWLAARKVDVTERLFELNFGRLCEYIKANPDTFDPTIVRQVLQDDVECEMDPALLQEAQDGFTMFSRALFKLQPNPEVFSKNMLRIVERTKSAMSNLPVKKALPRWTGGT